MSDQNNTNRRGFLGNIATAAAAFGISSIVSPIKSEAETPVNEPATHPSEILFKNLKGKHKMVFDVTAFRGGAALSWALAFLKTNNLTGTQDKELNVILVFRSAAIGMSLNDSMWSKYKLGEMYKVDDPELKAPALKNLFIIPDKEDPGMTIAELQARGVIFCVCELALEGNSEHIAEKLSMKVEDVHKDLLSNILPGIHLVPSGVWALGRAQEKDCAYCVCG